MTLQPLWWGSTWDSCAPGQAKVDTGMIHKVWLQEKADFLNKKSIIETFQSSGLLTLNEVTAKQPCTW